MSGMNENLPNPISSTTGAGDGHLSEPLLQVAYGEEYKARADIRNNNRPLLQRLRGEGVTTPADIAAERMRQFSEQTDGLPLDEKRKVALERFRPMKRSEVHAEHEILKSLSKATDCLERNDWEGLLRVLHFTERSLNRPDLRSEFLQQFRAEFGIATRQRLTEMVERGEASAFVGMGRRLGQEVMDEFQLDRDHVHLDPDTSVEQLATFANGLDEELSRTYKNDSRAYFKRDFAVVAQSHFVPYDPERGITHMETMPATAHAMAADLTEAVKLDWRDTTAEDGTVVKGKPTIVLEDADELGFVAREISEMSNCKKVLADKLAYGIVHEWRDEKDKWGRLHVGRPGEILEFSGKIYLDAQEIGDLAKADDHFADLWGDKVGREYFNEIDESTGELGTRTPGGTLLYAESLGRDVGKILKLANAPDRLSDLFKNRVRNEGPSSKGRTYSMAVYTFIQETPGMEVDNIVARGGLAAIAEQLQSALENEWRDYNHEDGTPAVTMPLETYEFARLMKFDLSEVRRLANVVDILGRQLARAVKDEWIDTEPQHDQEIWRLAKSLGVTWGELSVSAQKYGLQKGWKPRSVTRSVPAEDMVSA